MSENEDKIDRLRVDNETWREKLHDLQMENNGDNQSKKDPELASLDGKIRKLQKVHAKETQANGKVQLVNDQVTSWCARIVSKVDQTFNESISAYTSKTMHFKFEAVAKAIKKQLE